MKYFDFNTFKIDALNAFKRFPLFIVFCFGITILSIFTIEFDKDLTWNNKTTLYHIMSILGMGNLLILALTNWSEKQMCATKNLLIAHAVILVIMIIYYFISPFQFSSFELGMRMGAIYMGIFFLIMYLPYHSDNNLNAFWLYVKTLFVRLIIAYLFTLILYAGLAIALLAMDVLFNVKFDGILYVHLYIVLLGIFFPLLYISGLKKDYTFYTESFVYPKALRFLVLYIILPLVVLYIIILYLYVAKIIIIWQFPNGWVSNLVLSFSIAGLLSFFLIYPLKDGANKLISTFFKLYFWIMLPLIVLLFIAIFKRVEAYGITEFRYYVILIAFWLAFISVYQIITKYKNLKIIPLSLCIIAIVTSFGPWGAFSVSRNSQLNRFEKILSENNMIDNGYVVKPDSMPDRKTVAQISSIVSYIVTYHNDKDFQKYFVTNLDSLFKIDYNLYNKENIIMNEMGLKYISRWEARYDEENDENGQYVSFYIDDDKKNITDVRNVDFLVLINSYFDSYSYNIDDTLKQNIYYGDGFKIFENYNKNNNILTYSFENENNDFFILSLDSLFNNLVSKNPGYAYGKMLDEKEMCINQSNSHFLISYQLTNISADHNKTNGYKNISLTAKLLLKKLS